MSLESKNYEKYKFPFVYKEYGVRTSEGGVLNCGSNKRAATCAAEKAGAEVVFRSISEWLPLSDEG